MTRLLVFLPALLSLSVWAQTPNSAGTAIPAEAAAMTNPVQPTSESQAHAKTTFNIDCALCHGEKGNGKGDVVADMKLSMKDWTADSSALSSMKDGELFYIIKNGRGQMPGEGDRAKDADIWNLVIYVRSLAKK